MMYRCAAEHPKTHQLKPQSIIISRGSGVEWAQWEAVLWVSRMVAVGCWLGSVLRGLDWAGRPGWPLGWGSQLAEGSAGARLEHPHASVWPLPRLGVTVAGFKEGAFLSIPRGPDGHSRLLMTAADILEKHLLRSFGRGSHRPPSRGRGTGGPSVGERPGPLPKSRGMGASPQLYGGDMLSVQVPVTKRQGHVLKSEDTDSPWVARRAQVSHPLPGPPSRSQLLTLRVVTAVSAPGQVSAAL